MRVYLLVLAFLGFGAGLVEGQPLEPAPNPLFDDTVLPTVRITLAPDDLEAIFADVTSDVEYPAAFAFETPTDTFRVDPVGFRLRGNTSRYSQKKSFKVSFNTFTPGGDLFGTEKLNLNGEHNDPSILRAKLAWELFRDAGIPASRANHVRLFINGDYYGLQLNVEHIDEVFTESRFGTDAGGLYKNLWPADLTYQGPDAEDYYPNEDRRPYDYKSGPDADGYADLAHFIDVLNTTSDEAFPEAIERVFDVNGFLRILAIDVVTGSWDDYWYLKNNYYLFFDPTQERFVFIPYDYDNTFGIDWVGGDWGTRPVYAWGHPDEPRPLVDRLLANDDFRDRYTFYLRRTLTMLFTPERLNARIDALFAHIEDAAIADPHRPLDYDYSADDFRRSLTEAIGGHAAYGLKPYITTRRQTALAELESVDVPPIFSYLTHTPERPQTTSDLAVTVLIEDENAATVDASVSYRFTRGTVQTAALYDDGAHGDGAAGDGVYGATIPAPNRGANLFYTLEATDANGHTRKSAPQSAAFGFDAPPLVINEFMARNSSTITDETGAYPDWIELYHMGDEPLELAGFYLTDDFARPDRWALPDTTLQPGAFLIVWADDDEEDGPLHTNFQLSGDGEEIGLFFEADGAFAAADSVRFGAQTPDVSYGRLPDGTGAFGVLSTPTPGRTNTVDNVAAEPAVPRTASLLAAPYPNPFHDHTTAVLTLGQPAPVRLSIYDLLGRRIWHADTGTLPAGTHALTWDGIQSDGTDAPPGLYLIRVETGIDTAHTTRIVRFGR